MGHLAYKRRAGTAWPLPVDVVIPELVELAFPGGV
jgi:hypothetical protein